MKKLISLFTLFALPISGIAHHSFAPHFDSDKQVNISGTIIEYEQRNPHAYLNIRAVDADGRVTDWRCESHGYTQLDRNGITPDMLQEGTRVGISGSQHRRDPTMCFFDMVYLEDGRELSVNGTRNAQQSVEEERTSIFGTWMLLPNRAFTSSGPQVMYGYLTPAGRAYIEDYNPIQDDPAYDCSPVTLRRAWAAPSTPMAILRQGDNILIKHEWMDIERLVHMEQQTAPENTPLSVMGYSIGYFEEDTLVIETSHFSEGLINQYVTLADGSLSGVPHSDQMRTTERISLDRERNRLVMSIDHFDDAFFSRGFDTYTREYRPSDLDIQPFGCIPEVLK